MKFIETSLINDTVTSYDQTKVTLLGRAQLKTVDGDIAAGPPLNRFIDVQTDLGVTPAASAVYLTQNGRAFSISSIVSGQATLCLYNVNLTTGVHTVVGKALVNFPNVATTTHNIRSIKVYDANPASMKVYIQTTATVTSNGGLFLINNCDVADFTVITSVTYPLATSTNQKAVYFLQRDGFMGGTNQMISGTGLIMDYTNQHIYFHNGVSATHQYFKFDISATPSVDSTFTGVTVSVASPGLVTATAHGFGAGTRIVFTSGTLPTGLLLNTVYFVVAPVTANTFAVSATNGGAAINTTGTAGSGLTMMRAFGESKSGYLLTTGNLPVLSGVLLNTDSEDYAIPQHTTNSGFACAFIPTNSNFYLGRLSELTNGSTTWPSLITVNQLGTANQIVAPVATLATWSNVLDSIVFVTSGSIFVLKKFVNNQIIKLFGGSNNRYLETLVGNEVVELQPLTVAGLDVENGWLVCTTNTIGQRGIYLCDLRSDEYFDYSSIITPVLSTKGAKARFITTLDKLFDYTGGLKVCYRVADFSTPTSGTWTEIDFATDLSAIAVADEIQFKILFTTLGLDTCIHAQLLEFVFGIDPFSEMSDKWRGSVENSSKEGDSPFFSAFRMVVSDSDKKYFRAYDDSNVVIASANTEDNFADFDYSTSNGSTWTAMTSANGYPSTALTTEIRYRWTTPPMAGTKLTVSLKDS